MTLHTYNLFHNTNPAVLLAPHVVLLYRHDKRKKHGVVTAEQAALLRRRLQRIESQCIEIFAKESPDLDIMTSRVSPSAPACSPVGGGHPR